MLLSLSLNKKFTICKSVQTSVIDWHSTQSLKSDQLGLWFSSIVKPFSTRHYWWMLLPSQNFILRLRWENNYTNLSDSNNLKFSQLNLFSEKPFYFYFIMPFVGCLGLILVYTSGQFFQNNVFFEGTTLFLPSILNQNFVEKIFKSNKVHLETLNYLNYKKTSQDSKNSKGVDFSNPSAFFITQIDKNKSFVFSQIYFPKKIYKIYAQKDSYKNYLISSNLFENFNLNELGSQISFLKASNKENLPITNDYYGKFSCGTDKTEFSQTISYKNFLSWWKEKNKVCFKNSLVSTLITNNQLDKSKNNNNNLLHNTISNIQQKEQKTTDTLNKVFNLRQGEKQNIDSNQFVFIWENYLFQKANFHWFWQKYNNNNMWLKDQKKYFPIWKNLIKNINYKIDLSLNQLNCQKKLLLNCRKENNNNNKNENWDEFSKKIFSNNISLPKNYLFNNSPITIVNFKTNFQTSDLIFSNLVEKNVPFNKISFSKRKVTFSKRASDISFLQKTENINPDVRGRQNPSDFLVLINGRQLRQSEEFRSNSLISQTSLLHLTAPPYVGSPVKSIVDQKQTLDWYNLFGTYYFSNSVEINLVKQYEQWLKSLKQRNSFQLFFDYFTASFFLDTTFYKFPTKQMKELLSLEKASIFNNRGNINIKKLSFPILMSGFNGKIRRSGLKEDFKSLRSEGLNKTTFQDNLKKEALLQRFSNSQLNQGGLASFSHLAKYSSQTNLSQFSLREAERPSSLIKNFRLFFEKQRKGVKSNLEQSNWYLTPYKWKYLGNWSFYWNYFCHSYGSSLMTRPWNDFSIFTYKNKHSKFIVPLNFLRKLSNPLKGTFLNRIKLPDQNIFFQKWHSKYKTGFFYKRITKLELKQNTSLSTKKLDPNLLSNYSRIVSLLWGFRAKYKLDEVLQYQKSKYYQSKKAQQTAHQNLDQNSIDSKISKQTLIKTLNKNRRYKRYLSLDVLSLWLRDTLYFRKMSRKLFPVKKDSYFFTSQDRNVRRDSFTLNIERSERNERPSSEVNLFEKNFFLNNSFNKSILEFDKNYNNFPNRLFEFKKSQKKNFFRRSLGKAWEKLGKSSILSLQSVASISRFNSEEKYGFFSKYICLNSEGRPKLVNLRILKQNKKSLKIFSRNNLQTKENRAKSFNRQFLLSKDIVKTHFNSFDNPLIVNILADPPLDKKKISHSYNKRILDYYNQQKSFIKLNRGHEQRSYPFAGGSLAPRLKNVNSFFRKQNVPLKKSYAFLWENFCLLGRNFFQPSFKSRKHIYSENKSLLTGYRRIKADKFSKKTTLKKLMGLHNETCLLNFSKQKKANQLLSSSFLLKNKQINSNLQILSKQKATPLNKTDYFPLNSPQKINLMKQQKGSTTKGVLSPSTRTTPCLGSAFLRRILLTTYSQKNNMDGRMKNSPFSIQTLNYKKFIFHSNCTKTNFQSSFFKKVSSFSDRQYMHIYNEKMHLSQKSSFFEDINTKFKNLSSSFVIWRNKFHRPRDYFLLSYMYIDYLGTLMNSIKSSLSGLITQMGIFPSKKIGSIFSTKATISKRVYPILFNESVEQNYILNQNYSLIKNNLILLASDPQWSFSILYHLKKNNFTVYQQLQEFSREQFNVLKQISMIGQGGYSFGGTPTKKMNSFSDSSITFSKRTNVYFVEDNPSPLNSSLISFRSISDSTNSSKLFFNNTQASSYNYNLKDAKSGFVHPSFLLGSLSYFDSTKQNKNYLITKNSIEAGFKKILLLKNQQKYIDTLKSTKNIFSGKFNGNLKYRRKTGIFKSRILSKQSKIYNGKFVSNFQFGSILQSGTIVTNLPVKQVSFWFCTLLFHVCLISSLVKNSKSSINFCLKTIYSSLFVLNKYFVYIKYRIKRLISYIYQSNFQIITENIKDLKTTVDQRLDKACENLGKTLGKTPFYRFNLSIRGIELGTNSLLSLQSLTFPKFSSVTSMKKAHKTFLFSQVRSEGFRRQEGSNFFESLLTAGSSSSFQDNMLGLFQYLKYKYRSLFQISLVRSKNVLNKSGFNPPFGRITANLTRTRKPFISSFGTLSSLDLKVALNAFGENQRFFSGFNLLQKIKYISFFSYLLRSETLNQNKTLDVFSNQELKFVEKNKIFDALSLKNNKAKFLKQKNLKIYLKILQWNMLLTLLIGESELLAELEPYREMHWYFLKKFPIFLRTPSGKDYLGMVDYQADEKIRVIKQKIRQTIMILYLRSRKYESKLQNRSNRISNLRKNNEIKTRVNNESIQKTPEQSVSGTQKNYSKKISKIRQKIQKISPWKSVLTFLGKYSFMIRYATLNKRFRESLLTSSTLQPFICFGPAGIIFVPYVLKDFVSNFDNMDYETNDSKKVEFLTFYQTQSNRSFRVNPFLSFLSKKSQITQFSDQNYLNLQNDPDARRDSKRLYSSNPSDFFRKTNNLMNDFSKKLEDPSTKEKLQSYRRKDKPFSFKRENVPSDPFSFSGEDSLKSGFNPTEGRIGFNARFARIQKLNFSILQKLDLLKQTNKTTYSENRQLNVQLEFLINIQKLIQKYDRAVFSLKNLKKLNLSKTLNDNLKNKFLNNKKINYKQNSKNSNETNYFLINKNFYDWSFNERSLISGKQSMHFDTFDPKLRYYRFYTNFSKILSDVGGLNTNFSVHQDLGPLICKVYNGLFSKEFAKNYLLVSESFGYTENILFLVQALAGEIGMKLFMEDAKRLQRIGNRGINKAAKRLEKLFDIAQANVPALIFIEDIHVIGSKTKMIKVDEEQDDVEILARSLLSKLVYRKFHKTKSLREAYMDQNLFKGNLGNSKLRRSLKPRNPIPQSLVLYQLTRRKSFSNFFKNQTLDKRIPTKVFLRSKISPAFTTNAVLIWKLFKSKIATPNKRIKETPWYHIPIDAMRSIHPLTYSIRVKVAKITLLAIFTMGTRLRLVKDLIKLFEKTNYNSHQNFIVFATTNKVSSLDPSLRRPGRLEETICLSSVTSFSSGSRDLGFINTLNTFQIFLKNVPGFSKTFNLIDNTLFSSNLQIKEWSLINYLAEESYYSFFDENLNNFKSLAYKTSSSVFQNPNRLSLIEDKKKYKNVFSRTSLMENKFFKDGYVKFQSCKVPGYNYKRSLNNFIDNQRMTSFETKTSNSLGNTSKMQTFSSTSSFNYWQILFSNIILQRKKGFFDVMYNLRLKNYIFFGAFSNVPQNLPLKMKKSSAFLLESYDSTEGVSFKQVPVSRFKINSLNLFLTLAYARASQNLMIKIPEHSSDPRALDYITNLQLWSEEKTFKLAMGSSTNTFYNHRKKPKALKSYFLRFFSSKIGELLFNNKILWNVNTIKNESGLNTSNRRGDPTDRRMKDSMFNFLQGALVNNSYNIKSDWTDAYAYIKNVVTTSSLYSKSPFLLKLLHLEDVNKPRQKSFFESLNAGMLFEYYDFHHRAFFKKNNFSNEETLNLLILQKYMLNNQGRPLRKYVKLENSNRLWLFRILFTELGSLDNISLRATSMNYYYRNKIVLKQLFKLSTYQWWNWHLRKPLEQLDDVQDIAYFPCGDKYYNPRHRRWMLTNGFWSYWFSFDRNFYFDLYEQYMFESFQTAYLSLDENREILDYLAKLFICFEKLSETELFLLFNRYKL